jgi:hypothetical protein
MQVVIINEKGLFPKAFYYYKEILKPIAGSCFKAKPD